MSSKKFTLSVLESEPPRPQYRQPDKGPAKCQICQTQLIVVSDYSQFICPDCGKVVSLNRGGDDHPDRAA
jgi:hypothetical protein